MAFASRPTDPQCAEEPMYEKCPECDGTVYCRKCNSTGEVEVDNETLKERAGLDEADRAWSERQ